MESEVSILGGHLIEGRVEENITVRNIGHKEVKRCISCPNDCDGTLDDICAVEVGEVVVVAEGLELGNDVGPEVVASSFEVDEQDKGLIGFGVEDAVWWHVGIRIEVRDWILLSKDLEEGFDVEGFESAIWCQGVGVVADIEFLVEEPNVGFHPDTAGLDRFVKRYFAPIVVV